MASSDFPIDEAQIVGLFMEAVFYGLYLVSFGACMQALFSGKTRVNKTMLTASIILGIFATLDVAFGLRHVLDAFIWYHGPGGAVEEFEDISYWVNVMKTVDYVIQTLIGDFMLVYRCFVVYNKSWHVVVLPLFIWTGTLVSGSIVIYISVHLQVSTNLDEKHLVPFITSTLVLTMVQNLATTTLIAGRIWSIDRQVAQYQSTSRGSRMSLKPVVRIIIESGAIYTVSLLIFLVVYLCSNNSQYGVSDCIVQIVGIVFNMIIIRVHQGRTADQKLKSMSLGTSASLGGFSGNHSLPHLGEARSRAMDAKGLTGKPTRVKVAHKGPDVDADSGFAASAVETQ